MCQAMNIEERNEYIRYRIEIAYKTFIIVLY